MKANEAPEKIYLQKYDNDTLECLNKWNIHEEWTVKPCNEKIATNIGYTRADAFIEKACEFIEQNITGYIDVTHKGGDENITLQSEFVNYFKEFMKGE